MRGEEKKRIAMSLKSKWGGGGEVTARGMVSKKWTLLFCLGSFCAGLLFTNRMWTVPEAKEIIRTTGVGEDKIKLLAGDCSTKTIDEKRHPKDILGKYQRLMMLYSEKREKLEKEKGIIIRFVIGHSATSGGILDKAVEAEDRKHGDFMRLDHVEGYLELSAKTKIYFATAVSMWDAEFYIKASFKASTIYGMYEVRPVLAQKGVRYHEPEYWKFGEEGNKYFRHATGQLYAISKDLATYISINQHVLHKYANEDVSLGSWFIGLDVEHIDDRRLCCGTLLTVSGKPRQATSALLRLIGAAAVSASPLKGFDRFINDA
ncbi:hypothetical protein J5N97_011341 [Dioscorea zingiberensis]|uniref:Hexosyltransferase n=1 Tax=Dioscorea zingiberensis TaxID=325984 RepID=A0A9D5HNM3_9LILI|nr:hypothetical protein J5N97_011341 [Dioscorea zingiberensis]